MRDIDLVAGTVSVRQQLGRDGRLGPPKTEAGKRRLAIPSWLVDDLAALLARRGVTGAGADALVFLSSRGKDLRYQNWLRRYWQPACVAAGWPDLHFHDLRSMSATALVTNDVDVKTAQTRLGHSSPAVTLAIYARATAEADRRAADALGRVFGSLRAPGAHESDT
ncbi:MAG TPA: site-specific integrase [Acidimicrobiales bacterium]|nr:site-specific integrase [Acidimicrobiales bacterium]